MRKRDDEVCSNAAGIDIGASSHWVAVPRHLAEQAGFGPVRGVGAMTGNLNAPANWLLALGVDTVALESTGVYWIPVYEVLEQRGLRVWLVGVRQMKHLPGPKSDVQDCQWLRKLMSLGLLRAAWSQDGEVCVVRAVARQGEVSITEQASWVQRMQKALVQMNIQLTAVQGDAMGATARAVIRAIVSGEGDPKVLARHCTKRVKASAEDVLKTLTGNRRDEYLFVLGQALAMYDDIARRLHECDANLQVLLGERSRARDDLGLSPKAVSKSRVEFDVRQSLANWAGLDLTRINGIGVTVVTKLMTEIGPDVSRFATVKHFRSWLGLCPGTAISGGRVLSSGTKRSANRAREALKMAAMSLSRSDSALNGQAARQHRHRPQARTNGVLHAHPQRAISSTRASSARKNGSANAASPHSSAALPHWASNSTRRRWPRDQRLQFCLLR